MTIACHGLLVLYSASVLHHPGLTRPAVPLWCGYDRRITFGLNRFPNDGPSSYHTKIVQKNHLGGGAKTFVVCLGHGISYRVRIMSTSDVFLPNSFLGEA